MRWQEADHRPIRAMRVAIEVVANCAVVHDEQRPGAVRVGRVCVLRESGVEDLGDAGHRWMPGADLVGGVRDPHARIVQDKTSRQTVRSDSARGSELSTLAALIVFSFVSAGTPGPNNVVLWASGAQFGFRRTLPHVMGTSVGIGALAVAVAAGLGALVTAVPATQLILKATGSVYLLYLAYQIAISRAMQGQQVARPLSLGQAIVFQWLNPKGWIFVLSAVSAFRPRELPIAVGSALVILTMMLVVIPAASAWAAGGSLISRLTTSDRAHRALSIGLAALLAVSVLQLWI